MSVSLPDGGNDSFFGWKARGIPRFAHVVKIKIHPALLAVALISGLPNADAELPILEQPWLGYYAAFDNKRFTITVTPQGEISIIPKNEKDEQVSRKLAIDIKAGIEETLPDGKVVMKAIKVDTLESAQAPSGNLEKTAIRGKVTGDAEFELNLEQNRGIILIGGRVLKPGSLSKNPIRFVVRANIPNAYTKSPANPNDSDGAKKAKEKQAKKAEKALLDKIKNDALVLKWTDGTKVKKGYEETVDATTKEINGPGIASAEIEVSSYKGKRLAFTAAPNSSMSLRNWMPKPLHEGFMIVWMADTAKDPEGKARLAIEVR
jgi:hypothetical protein